MRGEILLQFLMGQAREGRRTGINGDVRKVIERRKAPRAGKLGNPGDEDEVQDFITSADYYDNLFLY
jgi:hypothetical protein